MRILLTNDDGIEAEGLECLEKIAQTLSDDVWVCAPAVEQSGKGRGITLTEPLRVNRLGDKRFAVTGTPDDAEKRALREVDLPALSAMGMHPYFLPQVSRLFKGAGYNHNQSEAAQLYAQRMGVKE